MSVAGLIVAAGRGHRTGASLPKQYVMLGNAAMLSLTVDALLEVLDDLLVVIHPDDRHLYEAALRPDQRERLLPPAMGGPTRSQSVLNGLEALAERDPEVVLIHDAARPFLHKSVAQRVLNALADADGALPALPVVDALWKEADGHAAHPVPREALWRAQTPQGFRFAPILRAHRSFQGDALDDVAVARAFGLNVRLVQGDEENTKITTAADVARSRAKLEKTMDVRTGQGFDVHAFEPGDHVMLCGVSIPHDRGLAGHSDADVGLHAITDAIFGALAEGDIGQWFPPSEPQWKGARSEIFLAKAVERVAARGFMLSNIDCTLICELPKIGPHAERMRDEVARITSLAIDRVSVKATTSERLGFTGRREGIAAMATATLVRTS